MSFYFLGQGPLSKSLIQRALIAKSYFPNWKIDGESQCEDVTFMKKGLVNLLSHKEVECGNGGALLRFLALRASRLKGRFVFKGSLRLFKRPQKELHKILQQLSCEVFLNKQSLIIESQGWHILGDALTVPVNRSSQFASALLLNSWNLERDLFISLEGEPVSFSYFQMTLSFLRSLGMKIKGDKNEYCILARQKITSTSYKPPADMSCLFTLSALAFSAQKEAVFTDWPEQSFQPDFIFPEVLKKMGFKTTIKNHTLKITPPAQLKPLDFNIKNYPDLFPVLSALCALAKGKSRLFGALHLFYKESDRIKETARLLEKCGCKTEIKKDGLVIEGRSFFKKEKKSLISFDPLEDHRMVMAAGVLKKAGFSLKILNPKVVNKSFPEFWSMADLSP